MTEKKITRKVISRADTSEQTTQPQQAVKSKKVCFFCQSKTNPSYTDTSTLRRFTTDRAKIVSRIRSNLCSKHQRAIAKQIEYARHLSLLPFTPRV